MNLYIGVQRGAGTATCLREISAKAYSRENVSCMVTLYLNPAIPFQSIWSCLFQSDIKFTHPSLCVHPCCMSLCPWLGEKITRTSPFRQRLLGPTIPLPFSSGPLHPFFPSLFPCYSQFIPFLFLVYL